MLPVSICSGAGPLDRMPEEPGLGSMSSSLQSAGVGGTASRLVPRPGGRLVRGPGGTTRSDAGDPDILLKLCDRDDGGGPGGGGGNGMPGSHRYWLGERLATRGVGPVSLMPPVEAARREPGGIKEGSKVSSSTRAFTWAVDCCKPSIAFIEVVKLIAFALAVTDESNLSAGFLDDARVEADAGGGGNVAAGAAIGDSVKNAEWVEIG